MLNKDRSIRRMYTLHEEGNFPKILELGKKLLDEKYIRVDELFALRPYNDAVFAVYSWGFQSKPGENQMSLTNHPLLTKIPYELSPREARKLFRETVSEKYYNKRWDMPLVNNRDKEPDTAIKRISVLDLNSLESKTHTVHVIGDKYWVRSGMEPEEVCRVKLDKRAGNILGKRYVYVKRRDIRMDPDLILWTAFITDNLDVSSYESALSIGRDMPIEQVISSLRKNGKPQTGEDIRNNVLAERPARDSITE